MRPTKLLLAGLLGLLVVLVSCPSEAHESDQIKVALKNRAGTVITSLTDGDLVKLNVTLTTAATNATEVIFELAPSNKPIGKCTVPSGAKNCDSEGISALGWFWGADGKSLSTRTIRAVSALTKQPVTTDVRVAPRPVVMVHGFLSGAATWASYSQTFLPALGLSGFAVGDGKADGVMNTGDTSKPTLRTNTLAENAAILGRYIADVKNKTKAEMVDIVAHSMGGLIARYYIDRLMQERDVAQLIMLGSPHGGSDCSGLPSALGFYAPASLELRPTYLREVFNKQITHRRGVPFFMLAGNPILESFKAPCTGVPSDVVVAKESASAITGPIVELPILHTDMTKSEEVFQQFVRGHLQKQPGEFPNENDPPSATNSVEPVQFTQVFKGRVKAGGTKELNVNLDQVAVASFALFDPSRSLDLTVRGASGNVIELKPDVNGLIKVDDPATMVHLGYGFENPKPGPWKVTLTATANTPSNGTDFALSARVIGGAVLRANASQLLPPMNEPVTFTGALELPGKALTNTTIKAVLRKPDGKEEELVLRNGKADWMPAETGVHGVDIVAQANAPDGSPIERTTFLSVEVQPAAEKGRRNFTLLLVAAGALFLLALWWLWRKFTRRKHA
jgi:pimeloyl-ACP methyl ester carboxylesterase